MPHDTSSSGDLRDQLKHAVAHLDHVLPGQASIKDFVHHNTVHGFQHLEFSEALRQVHQVTGIYGYLPAEQFRAYYAQGRVTQADLDAVLDADAELGAGEVIAVTAGGQLTRREVYRAALLQPLRGVTPCQLTWQFEELQALSRFQDGLAPARRQQLCAGGSEAECLGELWQACLQQLGLEYFLLHPEDLLDLSSPPGEEVARLLLAQNSAPRDGWEDSEEPPAFRHLRMEAIGSLGALLAQVGETTTLRGLLTKLSSRDILNDLRPLFLRHLASYLDQGLAAWHHPRRGEGFYAAWKDSALADAGQVFEGIPGYRESVAELPADPLDAVMAELRHLRLPEARWAGYLERLALELPGWSGMVNWLGQRPGYADLPPVKLLDTLAVRLVLERLFAQRACRDRWGIDARLDALDTYFRAHYAEFLVRHALYGGHMPEYLADLAQHLANRSSLNPADDHDWLHVAQLIANWRSGPAAEQTGHYSVHRDAWRLFRLCQHLGLGGAQLREFGPVQVRALFDCLDALDEQRSGFLWLQAYECHYRDRLFQALASNHGRGRRFYPVPAGSQARAQAQLVFCMDDREEGFRRHLEEEYPQLETLGAAGFFGVPINWLGLDDTKVTPLCPVVVVPSHEVREQADPAARALEQAHRARRRRRLQIKDWLHHELRRNLFSSALGIAAAAPLALLTLTGKILLPRWLGRWQTALRRRFDLEVPTQVQFSAAADAPAATPQQPRLGFTDAEQAQRVEGFLRIIGLTDGFAPLVVMMGHGSGSQNNPHLAAYDCGACSGRHGGPNARVFAAMANRPEVRQALRAKGIEIPADTWFLGAEHNTCDESVTWYDEAGVPSQWRGALAELKSMLAYASRASAHERCRRLASAPRNPDLETALRHMVARANDFSQARPELGHATNAAAFIGRRSMSRGAFLDRRVFLISYDPSQDPEGKVLETILLAVGPVGAGINLEYYFSTVNNERFGCGTKVVHNVTGFFGVMEGAASDLRTGLPRQMIEIHEAMRLQVLVEADPEILTAIYLRQPPLQELVGKGWLLLSAKHPDTGAISIFEPGRGWSAWQAQTETPPTVRRSPEWYRGHSGPLPPALVAVPGEAH